MADGSGPPPRAPDSASPASPNDSPLAERLIEGVIFQSRWLMAPVYLGMIACLGILIFVFFRELFLSLSSVGDMDEAGAILLVLTLIDLSLACNLVLIILFSGYENFVSKIESAADSKDRPDWMGTLDFSGLKIKLIASIVAISGIHLLKVFMDVTKYSTDQLMWFTIIHVTFVVSGVAFAAMDWIEAKTHTVTAQK
jgi:uncharacterized protein (TIGR00645 family)